MRKLILLLAVLAIASTTIAGDIWCRNLGIRNAEPTHHPRLGLTPRFM